jgi:hypothetical protein
LLTAYLIFISYLFSGQNIARGKNPEAHFNRARARGAQKDTGIVNDKPVLRGLKDGTKRNHQRQLALWHQFVEDNLKLDLVVLDHSLGATTFDPKVSSFLLHVLPVARHISEGFVIIIPGRGENSVLRNAESNKVLELEVGGIE